MILKRLKKSLASFLGCVLALSTVTLTPITARAEGETILGDLTCGTSWVGQRSALIEVPAEGYTLDFRSQTLVEAGWPNTPMYIVYQEGEDDLLELFVGRSDAWGWSGSANPGMDPAPDHGWWGGYNFVVSSYPANWDDWFETNKTGVDCTISVQQSDSSVTVNFTNGDLTSIATIPLITTGKVYVAFTGENCKLSGVPVTAESGGDEEDVFLECGDFWSAHTPGIEITEVPHTYTFHSTSDANAPGPWDAPVYVIFYSDDGLVNVDNPTYKEYAVMRSDNWWWDGAGKVGSMRRASEKFAEGFSWGNLDDQAKWLEANKNGVDITITTQLYKGNVLLGVSNAQMTLTYVIPVDTSLTNYLSLTGELCRMSNWHEVVDSEESGDEGIDLSDAQNAVDNPPKPAPAPAPSTSTSSTTPPAVEAVENGEVLTGTAWWTGMAIGSNHVMSGDGTWTWTVQASALVDGYGAFSVEFYDPATNGYITTGSDKNAWTAEGFNPGGAAISGIPAELASNLVEGHIYAVTVTRSGNTFTVRYVDTTAGTEICTLTITPGEAVSHDIQTHIMAQVGTFVTAFNEGSNVASFGRKGKLLGEILTGTAWWTGMTTGTNYIMKGDGTWTWTVKAVSLIDNYGAFSVEIFDPGTNGYITTGSDMNAWTAEGFDPANAKVSGVPAELASKLVEGHTYAVTLTRSGNTFTVEYKDHTAGTTICTLVITPGGTVSKEVQTHVMAQVGTFATAFNSGTLVAALGDSVPVVLYVIAVIGIAAIAFGAKKRFAR